MALIDILFLNYLKLDGNCLEPGSKNKNGDKKLVLLSQSCKWCNHIL